MLTLYNRERSGNCYKVRLMFSLLRVEYENRPIHREGKGRNIPAVKAWLARIQALPRYLPVPVYDGAGGALVE